MKNIRTQILTLIKLYKSDGKWWHFQPSPFIFLYVFSIIYNFVCFNVINVETYFTLIMNCFNNFYQNAIHLKYLLSRLHITDVIINFKTVGFECIIYVFRQYKKHMWMFDRNFDFRPITTDVCTLKAWNTKEIRSS